LEYRRISNKAKSLQFDSNFWDKKRFFHYPINGKIILIGPFLWMVVEYQYTKYDKNPAEEPYDIPGWDAVSIPEASNNRDTLYYNTARLNWNEYNVDYEYSQFDGFGNSGEGPLGFLTYAYGLVINGSILLLNGTINVTPYNAPSFSLQSGDRISMLLSFVFELSDDYNHDITIVRAFGVTIEKA
jgi:hypothetical protein